MTRCAHSAAALAGVDEKTVARYVAIRDKGRDPLVRQRRQRRPRSIDPFMGKIEEWVDKSGGRIRADVVHERLRAMGFTGTDRSTRRAVADAKAAWKSGHRRKYRPWLPEPGMWLQFDWGEGPRVNGRRTQLFCAWLAWSRYRVVIPSWDQTLGSLVLGIDVTLRRIDGAPTYLLTDNAKTVTMDRIAGLPVRHPEMVAAGRHYGCKVETCEPFDPESKGGAEHTVKIAKADLVPTTANLLPEYGSFTELADACWSWCERVNARPHRETGAAPIARLSIEREHLHVLPVEPNAIALGEERLVGDDQTIRWGSVRYSTPDGYQRQKVWCRVAGEELVITGRNLVGPSEIARHRLSTPGNPRILDEHYPHHLGGDLPRVRKLRPRTVEEIAFLDLGEGARRWLTEASAAGVSRIRSKMTRALELAAITGADAVDEALGVAAVAGRFDDGDLASILDHLARFFGLGEVVRADEAHSVQPGTAGWGRFGA
ncbi:IS21 family transposase [Nocardia terpenica]|uniref:IS21 family transposase n=1 Tax=Nocardia terpenica TaxID=455432 RepID=A0A6G9ZD88_9NOCA|nr:IS21 family transposase [Nocardia terpenica]